MRDAVPAADAAADAAAVTVTVVVCTRNGHTRGFLGAALDSVFGQTLPPLEVLLIDDGSDDNTAAAVARSHPQVRVLANTGRGLAAARNTGVRAARGSWIAFIDDDDLWHADKLAVQVRQAVACAQPSQAILVARNDHVDQHGVPVYMPVSLHYASWPACLLGSPVAQSGVMVSKALLLQAGLFDETIRDGAAYECWIRCLAAGVTIHYSDTVLLYYRRHPGQMTGIERRTTQLLTHDAMIMRHYDKLAPALVARVGTARRLNNTRSLLVHASGRVALGYWRTASLPCRPGVRVLGYAVLDALACRAPQGLARPLRRLAFQLLLGRRHAA